VVHHPKPIRALLSLEGWVRGITSGPRSMHLQAVVQVRRQKLLIVGVRVGTSGFPPADVMSVGNFEVAHRNRFVSKRGDYRRR
jgi:hypothetical protein